MAAPRLPWCVQVYRAARSHRVARLSCCAPVGCVLAGVSTRRRLAPLAPRWPTPVPRGLRDHVQCMEEGGAGSVAGVGARADAVRPSTPRGRARRGGGPGLSLQGGLRGLCCLSGSNVTTASVPSSSAAEQYLVNTGTAATMSLSESSWLRLPVWLRLGRESAPSTSRVAASSTPGVRRRAPAVLSLLSRTT